MWLSLGVHGAQVARDAAQSPHIVWVSPLALCSVLLQALVSHAQCQHSHRFYMTDLHFQQLCHKRFKHLRQEGC